MVHVIRNEHRAAMQHENSAGRSTHSVLSTGGSVALCLPAIAITVTVLQPIRIVDCGHSSCRIYQMAGMLTIPLLGRLAGYSPLSTSQLDWSVWCWFYLWSTSPLVLWSLIGGTLVVVMLMVPMTMQRQHAVDSAKCSHATLWCSFFGFVCSRSTAKVPHLHSPAPRSSHIYNWPMSSTPVLIQRIPPPLQPCPSDVVATTTAASSTAAVALVVQNAAPTSGHTRTSTSRTSPCPAATTIVILNGCTCCCECWLDRAVDSSDPLR